MESGKATALEDKGLAKEKRPLGDKGGGGDVPESGKRPKVEETKPRKSSMLSLEMLYYQEYLDHNDSMTSDNKLAMSTCQLVSKAADDDLVKSLLNSIIHRMRLKWFETEHLILLKRTMDDNIPLDSPLRSSIVPSIRGAPREGVSNEELCQELQFAVELKSAVLGESCVNSVAALLSCFQDNCKRLKELEATTKSQKERESKNFVRAASANA
ncbi:hypothetical protein FEM48_Zijuj02G0028500 [Ziziphus jujuba var. spinosa]|uniref:Uncharacterized protein n=1 Tax=Ziziphus jujuba var. spinosa TaxID=714518 RepID=A0A978VT68_ZIZJJ|nr:hypothetical protein FEM48_Zijuj02G0028500 [Ziziphus jujuba var. spinosa]